MLHTYETGRPESEAILFLHAGGLGGKSWLPVMERLPEFYCLAPDLPEQGSSKAIPYSIEGSAGAVLNLIRERAAGGKAHIVALSLGGPVAFTILRMAPHHAGSVIISGGSGRFSPFLAALGKSTVWLYRFYKQDYLVRETMRQHGIPAEYEELVREDLLTGMAPDFMRRYMGELATWELPQQIENRLLIVVGEKEVKAAVGIARGYLKRFPNAAGAIAPGAKHAWSLQFPDLFAAMTRAWITGQPLPGGFRPLTA